MTGKFAQVKYHWWVTGSVGKLVPGHRVEPWWDDVDLTEQR
jgi:hypothetical protein